MENCKIILIEAQPNGNKDLRTFIMIDRYTLLEITDINFGTEE